jgi:glycosyltransferase involved in cell wall biosynthesis
MKICLIGEYTKANWKGSATNKVQKYLSSSLVKKGHLTTVLELPGVKGKLRKLFLRTNISFENDIEIVQGGVMRLIFFVVKNKFDVIHFIVTRKYMLFIVLILPFIKAKKVTTFHDTLILSGSSKYHVSFLDYILYRSLIFFSDQIFIYSNIDFNAVSKFSNSKAFLIKNGVNTNFFIPGNERTSGNDILFAGGLGKEYKGLKFLEDSLARVDFKYSLVVCGENPLNLTHSNYIGPLSQENFKTQLQKAKMLIIPSRYDAFSINGLEAMACGTPIIITKNCGLAQHLTDGRGCFIIEYGNIEQLSSRISQLLSDESLHKKMCFQAREVAEKFDWEKIIDEYIHQYEN